MDVSTFSQWLVRQGNQVYQTESSYWYNAGPHVLQAFPFHWLIQPTESELRKLMLGRGILALRYSSPLESPRGKVSYHIELRRPYTMNMLKSQARNGVKRGMGCFKVEPIPFSRLAEEGWLLQRDTLERQDRSDSMQQETWRRICLAAENLPGFVAWGAIADGELAAALFTARIGDIYSVPYALSRSKYMRDHVNNVLFFQASTAILAEAGISRIFFTVQSLDAPPAVDEFKLRMGFTPRPVRQRVVLHPLLTPLGTKLGHAVIQGLMKRNPKSNALAKTEGMLRFHMLGKRALADQEWPDCVAQHRQAFVKDKSSDQQTPEARTGMQLGD